MKNILVIILCYFPFLGVAQKNPVIINSKEILLEAVAKFDDEKYKDAIALFSKIPSNDTNYQLACYELALTYQLDKQYDKAIETVKEGIETGGKLNLDCMFLLGAIYDDKKDYAMAQQAFDSVISKYPNNAKGYYSKGLSYVLERKFEQALRVTEKALLIDPYNQNTHYTFGFIHYKNGNIIPAYIAFATYLFSAPADNRKNNAIGFMSNMAMAKDTFLRMKDNRIKIEGEDDYSDAESIVLSKMALDKNYKSKSSLNDAVIKQLQAILDLTTKSLDNKSFFAKYYLPIYKKIMDDGNFEALSYRIASGLEIEEVNKYVKKNENLISSLTKQLSNAYAIIGFYRTEDWVNKEIDNTKVGYYFSKGDLFGKGIFNEKKAVKQGDWEIYYDNGKIKSLESYNLAGKVNGKYKTFYKETGTVDEEMEFVNDNSNGPAKKYFENGNLMISVTMVNGKRNGLFSKYYNNGNIQEETNYTNGVANGVSKNYYYNGGIETEGNFKADKMTGKFIEYYSNGSKYYETTMVDGEKNGAYVYYNADKSIFSKGVFKNNKKEGAEIVYHPNGKIKTEYNYDQGKLDGTFISFNEKGVKMYQETFRNGEKHEKALYYDEQENIWNEIVFNKGRYKEVNYFNPLTKQAIVQQDITSKSENNLQMFDRIGIKTADIVCDREGYYNGKLSNYFENGKVKTEGNYLKGKAQGEHKEYYMNGKVSVESNYVDDKLNGMYKSYFFNGKLAYEGNYLNNKKEGIWYTYNALGILINEEYFSDGESTGKQTHFNNAGKLKKIRTTKDGLDMFDTYFDASGKVSKVVNLFNQKEVSYYDEFGFNYLTCTAINNCIVGDQLIYNRDGSVSETRKIVNGEYEGAFKNYNDCGILISEGNYLNGKKHGLWKTYDDQGLLSREENFYNGDTKDSITTYYYNGKLENHIEYFKDLKHGRHIKYAPNGELMYQLFFDEGTLIGYTYKGKDGKLVPTVSVKNGAGSVNAFYENGQSVGTVTYENSRLNGLFKLFHSNGKLMHEETMSYNNTEGVYKTFYENGAVRIETSYSMDNLNGPYKKYDVKGQYIEDGIHKHDNPEGDYKYFSNGKLTHVIHYENGVVKSIEKK
jgi:uncharacterized protein